MSFKQFSLFIITIAISICFINLFGSSFQKNQEEIKNIDIVKLKIDSLTSVAIKLNNDKMYDSSYRVMVNLYYYLDSEGKLEADVEIVKKMISIIPEKEIKHKIEMNYMLYYVYDAIGRIHDSYEIIKDIDKYAIATKDTALIAKNMNSFGIYYLQIRNYKEGLNVLTKGLELSKNLEDQDTYKRILNNLAIACMQLKMYERARSLFKEALKLKEERYIAIHQEIARTYLFEENQFYEGKINSSKNIDLAFYHIELALKRAIKEKDELSEYDCYAVYGDIYAQINKLNLAHEYYKKAFSIIDNISYPREAIKLIFPFAETKLELNKPDEAIALLDKSLSLIGYDRKIEAGKTLPSEMFLIEIFAEKASCYLAKYDNDKNVRFLNDAAYNLDKSIEVLTDMRLYHDDPSSIEEISKEAKSVFEKSIATSLKQYQISKDKKYLEHAFGNIQKYGAFNLRKNINERKALELAVDDANTKSRFLKAKTDFLNEEYKLSEEYSDEGFDAFNNAKTKFIQIRDSLEKHNKKFSKLSQKITYVSIKDIQKKLKSGEAFVQYFYCPEKLFTINIYKNEVTYSIIDNDDVLKNNVQDYITLLNDPAYGEKGYDQDSLQNKFQTLSYDLYGILVESSIKNRNLTKLIIVPDGALFRIPFESFTTSPNAKWNLASSFLLSKYTVDYLYYAAQFLKDEVKEYQDYFVGFGLEYDKYTLESMMEGKEDTTYYWIKEKFRSKSLSHLYFADDEVKAIEQHFDGKTYLNQDATKINLTTNMHNAGILHISAHSCVDYADPQKSAIVLHKKDSLADNLLKYDDITACDLNSQMVILSACSSASGKVSEAEGISSLSKAFFEAGSQSVVGSYWSVPDEISKIFMEAFYEKLKSGKPKDEALRETKLEFMTTNTLVNPYYKRPQFWAAWTLYGDVQPLKVNDYKYWWMAISALALGLITFFFFKRRNAVLG